MIVPANTLPFTWLRFSIGSGTFPPEAAPTSCSSGAYVRARMFAHSVGI
jgi:hypothetical protein